MPRHEPVKQESPTIPVRVGGRASINPAQPNAPQLERGKRVYRVGDRVIQLRNSYDLGIFNGDLGHIHHIDLEEQEMHIRFGEKQIRYDFADVNELALAYAITIHRSQGSEYPVGILPLHTQHFPMLSRNLVYTGLTRAKKLAVMVGTKKAIALAVKQVSAHQRYTHLAARLRELSKVRLDNTFVTFVLKTSCSWLSTHSIDQVRSGGLKREPRSGAAAMV